VDWIGSVRAGWVCFAGWVLVGFGTTAGCCFTRLSFARFFSIISLKLPEIIFLELVQNHTRIIIQIIQVDAIPLTDILPQNSIISNQMPIVRHLRQFIQILRSHVSQQKQNQLLGHLRNVVTLQFGLNKIMHMLNMRMLTDLEYLLEGVQLVLIVPLFECVQPRFGCLVIIGNAECLACWCFFVTWIDV